MYINPFTAARKLRKYAKIKQTDLRSGKTKTLFRLCNRSEWSKFNGPINSGNLYRYDKNLGKVNLLIENEIRTNHVRIHTVLTL